MMEVEDWELVRRAADGDRQAFSTIVARHHRPVIRFCCRMTGSMTDAEDIAQETFWRLYQALDRLDPRTAFTTVLFCIARNATLNQLRGKRRHERKLAVFEQETALRKQAAAPTELAQRRDMRERIMEAMEHLSVEFREALVLREFQGFDYEQIAAILECPVGTVRSRLARAREQLRQRLLHEGDDLL